MGEGVKILGTITKKCFVKQEGEKKFRIILTEGLNRQIRRMCETLGYKVVSLVRIRIMNITLKNIEKGKWRFFTENELSVINNMTVQSNNASSENGMDE
jgi:23S rRNA pseudouridine2604 synthase